VLAGHAVDYELGHRLERLRESLGGLEHWLLGPALVGTAALLASRFTRARAGRD
jgi:hypothetical protein